MISLAGKKNISAAHLGKPLSAEHKAKLAAAMRNKTQSAETRAKRSEALRGREVSEETRKKLSAAAKRIGFSPQARAAQAAAMRGKKLPATTKQKLSAARAGEKNPFFGMKHSAATKQKLSAAMTGEKNPFFGKHHSAEAKKKISDADNRRWARIRHDLTIAMNEKGKFVTEQYTRNQGEKERLVAIEEIDQIPAEIIAELVESLPNNERTVLELSFGMLGKAWSMGLIARNLGLTLKDAEALQFKAISHLKEKIDNLPYMGLIKKSV